MKFSIYLNRRVFVLTTVYGLCTFSLSEAMYKVHIYMLCVSLTVHACVSVCLSICIGCIACNMPCSCF